MAEAFLQIVLENLSSLIQGEIGLIMGVNDEMNKLSSTLTTIQAVLEDAEDKQLKDKAIRIWLRKLNNLSYEIDDVLDECATEVAKLEYQNRKSKVFSIKKILYKHKIGRRMKNLTAKLDAVAAEREKFHLRETAVVLRSKVPAMRETGSVLNESHHVYGRDEEKEKFVDILVNEVKDRDELSVLPIVGVGGLGKTTFAQLVFNEKRVTDHFDVKLWVCVSDDFDPKTLIKAMIESSTRSGSSSNLTHLDSLQHSLLQELSQKRYLLVLDDVWNEDQEKWLMLKDLLTCGSAGSSIIVTTRLNKAADIMSTIPTHYLEGLSEENCWLLFKERAFAGKEEEHTKLEAIGKQIVKKCGGVPLAAKALGGLLRFKRKEDEWLHVKESELWNLPQEESSILPALRLSYHNLPFALRHCFAYCSLFPKDTRMKKDELVLHWIAQGYVSSNGTLNEESIADEIFDELVLRSMFQNVNIRDYDGSVSFQMHDLVHDLAQSIMENRVPGAMSEFKDRGISAKIRHVDLLRKSVAFPTSTLLDCDLHSILEKFIRLRILDASYTRIWEVPSLIGNLKHVRYLNFSETFIRTLPDALCSLWNLKVLNLNECRQLASLPKNMRHLRNLRHLFLERCWALSHMPPRIGELTLLKTLSTFSVSRGKNSLLGELQLLDLGGDLCILHLERVEDPVEAMKAKLAQKPNLRKLSFKWETTDDSSQSHEVMDEKVLEALEPHPNVKELFIEGFRGENFPHWMGSYSTLENLITLFLSDCPNCSSLPQVLGELPHLKELYLSACLGVEYIIEDDVQGSNLMKPKFPSLHLLSLWNLPRLKGLIKGETGVVFPNLEDLTARKCPLFTLPQLSSIRYLYCNSVMLPSFYKLDNLTTLCVIFDDNKIPVPKEALQNLINLKSLTILHGDEHSLPEEGLQGLKSLTSLDIRGFDTLTCLPESWLSNLTSLEFLRLYGFSELVDIPEAIKCLQNLTSLSLMTLPKMACLPNALQHLTSLQTLHLFRLFQLTSLPAWLGNLTSLAWMYIDECPKLVSFPASIIKLGKLRRLSIIKCPELWRQCEKGRGEEWHKISHIPYLSNRHD